MDKYKKHKEICDELNELYIKKNHDYGDSFGESFKEEGMAMPRIRLGDKFKRFQKLSRCCEQQVKDESLRDTLIDLANYAIMTIVEMELGKETLEIVVECKEKLEALEFDPERCTMTNCFYNNDCYCSSVGDLRNPELLDDCPDFMED